MPICPYYDSKRCVCRIVGLIPSQPTLYCRGNPNDCPVYSDVKKLGEENAVKKNRKKYEVRRFEL